MPTRLSGELKPPPLANPWLVVREVPLRVPPAVAVAPAPAWEEWLEGQDLWEDQAAAVGAHFRE